VIANFLHLPIDTRCSYFVFMSGLKRVATIGSLRGPKRLQQRPHLYWKGLKPQPARSGTRPHLSGSGTDLASTTCSSLNVRVFAHLSSLPTLSSRFHLVWAGSPAISLSALGRFNLGRYTIAGQGGGRRLDMGVVMGVLMGGQILHGGGSDDTA
jgi:hypothetical protein